MLLFICQMFYPMGFMIIMYSKYDTQYNLIEVHMISFSEYLNEGVAQPLLEAVSFKVDGDTHMVGTLSEFKEWYRIGGGDCYTTDGKWSFKRDRRNRALYVVDTSKYGKAGNGNVHRISISKEAEADGGFFDALTSIDGIVETAERLVDTGVIEDVRLSTSKNMSVACFNPAMLKNFKSVGSVANKDKVTKSQARKIIASGDFDNISHDYRMRDDNYNSSGEIKLTYGTLRMVLDTLDSSRTFVDKKGEGESFNIYVHSNLSYYINRD